MTTLWAAEALTQDGWARDVRIVIGQDGRIAEVEADAAPEGERLGLLLPAPANLHSHAFQRAMAGLTEAPAPAARAGAARDSFWSWRRLMYRFLDRLTPDDVQAVAAQVQMEMLEAGYAASVEFHYLHHAPDGSPYARLGEMAERICAAAEASGIGLTLAPVLYMHGGCDKRPLGPGQRRFGCGLDAYARLLDEAEASLPHADSHMAVAPHSLRAVDPESLARAVDMAGARPIHIHLAEQAAEVAELRAHWGARPAEWLLANAPVDARWCAIHCTQMEPGETRALAKTGAVAGLCPLTEANLGDGVFDGVRWIEAGGAFGVGSDSNTRIALAEELRTLEHSQRLRDGARAVLTRNGRSVGRTLYDAALAGGAQAAGRASGAIAPGMVADLTALDAEGAALAGLSGDVTLDSWVFAADDRLVRDVWSAGRRVVRDGRHVAREQIETRFIAVVRGLRDAL